MAKEINITKKYADGRIISINVSEDVTSFDDEITKEMKHQDAKYYSAMHTSCNMDSILDAFKDLCSTLEWD